LTTRKLVIGALAITAVAVPAAEAFKIAPLGQREAVVVASRARAHTVVVAFPTGRLLTVHTPRTAIWRPGTRVTLTGIKWGTPIKGIKWARQPKGIKWGIKWGRNGTYQSPIVAGKSRSAIWTVKGPIVKRFGNRAVAIGVRGATVVVPFTVNGAVAGIKWSKEAFTPPVGSLVQIRISFSPSGRITGLSGRFVKPPIPGQALPVAGRVARVNRAKRTILLVDRSNPRFPLSFLLHLPRSLDIGLIRVGQEVAAEGLLRPDGSFAVTTISQNGTFTAADAAANNQSVPGRAPACGNSRELAICTGQTAGGGSGGGTTTAPPATPPATPPAAGPATTPAAGPPAATPPGTGPPGVPPGVNPPGNPPPTPPGNPPANPPGGPPANPPGNPPPHTGPPEPPPPVTSPPGEPPPPVTGPPDDGPPDAGPPPGRDDDHCHHGREHHRSGPGHGHGPGPPPVGGRDW
jgi:hypothetical protein